MLTDDEVVRLIRIAVDELGITEVRFTGGEPLIRRGFPEIVRQTALLRPRPQISVTTNGLGLDKTARRRWRQPGSTGSTSASTRSAPRRSRRSPGVTGSSDVLRGLEAAASGGPHVPSRSTPCCCAAINDDQAPELLGWCMEHGYELRFIEQMPLDAQHGWPGSR